MQLREALFWFLLFMMKNTMKDTDEGAVLKHLLCVHLGCNTCHELLGVLTVSPNPIFCWFYYL